MEEKPSLYELLGLNDKASPEQIQSAYEQCREALENTPDGEERHNRLAILQDARDVLNDRRQRAGYDRRRRDRRNPADHAPAARLSRPAVLLALVALGGASAAWHQFTVGAPGGDVQPPVATRLAARAAEPPASDADIAALLPPAAAPEPLPAATTAASATTPAPGPQPKNQPRPVAEAPHGATLMKIADSTFAVVGGAGMGTAVAIERDKLLTNCHVIAPNVLKGPMYAVSVVTGARTLITEAAFLITEDACVVHAPGLNGKPVATWDAGQLPKGTPIFNIGFVNGRAIFSAGKLLGMIKRGNQTYMVSSNYCDQGVSGGPLVDAEGRLVGLTSGGPKDRSFCLSLTSETARRVLDQTLIAIDAFPPNYTSNLARHW